MIDPPPFPLGGGGVLGMVAPCWIFYQFVCRNYPTVLTLGQLVNMRKVYFY